MDLLKCPQAALNQSEFFRRKAGRSHHYSARYERNSKSGRCNGCGFVIIIKGKMFMGNIESSTWLRGYIFNSISIYLELEECWLNINNHQQTGGGGA